MALPNDTNSLSYSYDGSPFCKLKAKGTIDATTFEYSYDGSPWWAIGITTPVILGHIKSINGVLWEHIKSYNGVEQSHIKTASGIEG